MGEGVVHQTVYRDKVSLWSYLEEVFVFFLFAFLHSSMLWKQKYFYQKRFETFLLEGIPTYSNIFRHLIKKLVKA